VHPDQLDFSKLEALGNDFVLVDARKRHFEPTDDLIRRLGDRQRGIGFDQLLILKPSLDSSSVCRVEIFNRDASQAEQCGNGMRAVALWLHDHGELEQHGRVDTPAGQLELDFNSSDLITVSMGIPDFRPESWGWTGPRGRWRERFEGGEITVQGVSMGNPHLVVQWPEPPNGQSLTGLATHLTQLENLGQGANINLAFLRQRDQLELLVSERGAGPTLACGSGACASAAVMIASGQADSPLSVHQPGGTVVINWTDQTGPLEMTGPARHVFDGKLNPEMLT
jgi:diaminopimelate epimerase